MSNNKPFTDIEQLIQDRAPKAARNAISILEVTLSPQDIEDVEQVAAIGFWEAWQKKQNIGYAYVAARNAAMKFIIRVLMGNNPMDVVEYDKIRHFLVARTVGQRGPLPEDVKERLFRMFLESRSKKGERGREAAMRDVAICDALASEGGNALIAQELGYSPRTIRTYRYRIQDRLREIAETLEASSENQ
jgi:hypothetical protein